MQSKKRSEKLELPNLAFMSTFSADLRPGLRPRLPDSLRGVPSWKILKKKLNLHRKNIRLHVWLSYYLFMYVYKDFIIEYDPWFHFFFSLLK